MSEPKGIPLLNAVLSSFRAIVTLRFTVKDVLVVIGVLAFALSVYRSDGFGLRRVRVASMQFSPDATQLALATLSARERIGPVEWLGRAVFGEFRKQDRCFKNVAQTISLLRAEDGKAIRNVDQQIKRGGRYTRVSNTFTSYQPDLLFLDNNKLFFVDYKQNTIRTADSDVSAEELLPLGTRVGELASSADGSVTAYLDEARTILVIRQVDLKGMTTIPLSGVGNSLRITPDGSYCCLICLDHVFVLRTSNGSQVAKIPCGNFRPGVEWLHDDKLVVTCRALRDYLEFTSLVVHSLDAKGMSTMESKMATVFRSACAFESGTFAAFNSARESMGIFDSVGKELSSFAMPFLPDSLAFSTNGTALAVAHKGKVRMYDTSGNLQWEIDAPSRYRPHILYFYLLLFVAGRLFYVLSKRRGAMGALAGTSGSEILNSEQGHLAQDPID